MLIFDADGFDWTEGNFEKCQKHGVSIDEIESFFSSDPDVYADPAHSINEQRLRAIGRTSSGRALFVAFTLRMDGGLQLIRPISARYMHQKESQHYERQKGA